MLALVGAGITTGLAGCSGGNGDDGGGGGDTATAEPTAEPTSTPASSGGGDGVPSEYETATSLSGTQRNPDSVSAKDAVNYQAEPSDGQQCTGCQFYIEDKNDDGMGACAIVEGTIDPSGWCASYVAYEE
jgi:hypothetical protein